MDKFEERKAIYANKLIENINVIEREVFARDEEEQLLLAQVLFAPRNELEVRFAYAFVSNMVDADDFMYRESVGLSNNIPFEEVEKVTYKYPSLTEALTEEVVSEYEENTKRFHGLCESSKKTDPRSAEYDMYAEASRYRHGEK